MPADILDLLEDAFGAWREAAFSEDYAETARMVRIACEKQASAMAAMRTRETDRDLHWRQREDRWRLRAAAILAATARVRALGPVELHLMGPVARVEMQGGKPVALLVALAADRG